MRLKTLLTLLVSLLLAAPLFAAKPANLLQNPQFDDPDTTRPWVTVLSRTIGTGAQPDVGWIGIDALANPESGSMRLSGAGFVMQCAPVTAGKSYDFGARILVNTRPRFSTLQIFVQTTFFEDDQCLGNSLAEVLTDSAAPNRGRWSAISKQGAMAPKGAHSALVSIVSPTSASVANNDSVPNAAAYIDDVFLQESGGCAPGLNTLCLAGDTLRVSMRYVGSDGLDLVAQALQTAESGGYFYTGGDPASPDITIKAIDLSSGNMGKWIVVGGLTSAKVVITVEDVTTHDQRTYVNVNGQVMEPFVDVY